MPPHPNGWSGGALPPRRYAIPKETPPPTSSCTQISSNNIEHLCGWAEQNRSSCQLSAPQLTVVQRVPAVARRRSII